MGKQSRRKNKGSSTQDKKARKERLKERHHGNQDADADEALDLNNARLVDPCPHLDEPRDFHPHVHERDHHGQLAAPAVSSRDGSNKSDGGSGRRDGGGRINNNRRVGLLPLEIEVGDRVYYVGPADKDWQWGVVKAMSRHQDSSNTISYSILPWEASEDRDDLLVTVEEMDFHRSRIPLVTVGQGMWTLRFHPGDKVFCRKPGFSEEDQGAYVLATVDGLRPRSDDDVSLIDCYRCVDDASGSFTFVTSDTDDSIQAVDKTKRPRFSKGDKVVFKTDDINNRWIQGEVHSAFGNESGFRGGYSVISYEKGNPFSRYITKDKDTDEYIARADAGPRERLFDAIDQNCSYSHLDDIVTTSKLDVSSLRDLILSRAIKACSYDALGWLQDILKIDLDKIRDADGNGLLLQIAALPKADRFFEKAARSSSKGKGFIPLDKVEDPLISQVDQRGRSWLHRLVIAGNLRALDFALSPQGAWAWALASKLRSYSLSNPSKKAVPMIHSFTQDEKGTNVRDAAKLLGRHDMVKMIDDYAMWQTFYELAESLEEVGDVDVEKIKSTILPKFGARSEASILGRLDRVLSSARVDSFVPNYYKCVFRWQSLREAILHDIVLDGNLQVLSWLLEGCPALLGLLRESNFSIQTMTNVNEFAQPELYDASRERINKIRTERLQLVSLAAHGKCDMYYRDDVVSRTTYASTLQHRLLESSGEDVAAILKSAAKEYDSSARMLFGHRIHLLYYDNTLDQRLKMLNYLVKEKRQSPPDSLVLDVIRWRKCGVLRWMVSESLIDLTIAATEDPKVVRNTEKVHFLGDQSLPQSTSVGEFLAFAAVEYDDLQTLQWLVNDQNVSATFAKCNGWNLLHACGYFGRTECAHWLLWHVTQSKGLPATQKFVSEPCGRERHKFVAHLAAQNGFVQLADFLLSSGCPSQDTKGKPMSAYAKKSPHAFVRAWGERIESSTIAKERFEEDMSDLYEVPDDIAVVRDHILQSQCLDFVRWKEGLEIDHATDAGPRGKSFRNVVEDVCNMGEDFEFYVWLCRTLTPSWSDEDNVYEWLEFWECLDGIESDRLDQVALVAFVAEKNDSDPLAALLRKRWTRDIMCHDPVMMNPVLEVIKLRGLCDVTYLAELRDSLLLDELSFRVLELARKEVEKLLASGAPVDTIAQQLECTVELSQGQEEGIVAGLPMDRWVFSEDGVMDLNSFLPCGYERDHPLANHSLFYTELDENHRLVAWLNNHPFNDAFVVLTVECCEELIRWSLDPCRSGWDATKELKAVRIAAYLGHRKIVDIFLQNSDELSFSSSLSERREAALLGALEAGFVEEIENRGLRPGPSPNDFSKFQQYLSCDGQKERESSVLLHSSVVGVTTFACVMDSQQWCSDRGLTAKHVKTVKWVEGITGIGFIAFVRAAILFRKYSPNCFNFGKFIDLYRELIKLGLKPFNCQKEVSIMTDEINYAYFDEQVDEALVREWLALLVNLGLDIQSAVAEFECGGVDQEQDLLQVVRPLQAEQLRSWSNCNIVWEGGSLEQIQDAVASGVLDLNSYYSSGLKLIHIATVYDRLDILEWLVAANSLQLEQVDGSGRCLQEVAAASNAASAALWISRRKAGERISLFVSTSIHRRYALREKRTRLRLVTSLQAWRRGYLVRRMHRGRLLSRLEAAQRFQVTWANTLSIVDGGRVLDGETSWAAIKTKRFDLLDSIDENGEGDTVEAPEEHTETSRKMASATSLAAKVQQDESWQQPDADGEDDQPDRLSGEPSVSHVSSQSPAGFDRILLTRAVLRWRRQADPKYLAFFVRRIKQLAAGDRSLLLRKSLTGCKTVIYEAKLEAGHRILWTEESHQGLIVWYVAKHDEVSRLVRLMDKAESRSNRQLTSASNLPEIEQPSLASSESRTGSSDQEVLLDPQGDIPLRLYNLPCENIHRLESLSWRPPLHLTNKERKVIETEGTVLLLGRSGTGKTICICNRIDSDRHRAQRNSSFRQLFVARSKRICTMVEDLVGNDMSGSDQTSFRTFKRLVVDCETELPTTIDASSPIIFRPSKRMDFARFKRDVFRPGSTLDPLLVWTQIRSLIKGSIAKVGQPRSREEYLGLGKNECRLTQEQRRTCYNAFESYERHVNECKLWDDCDRITCILQQLQSDPEARFAMAYDKVYVDEIQDYTQLEIALFFMLCRHQGDLFLAGDPAQSVVEGSDFRFEDIRTVAHHLYQKDASGKKGIPDKPLKLNVNFRSHSGILNVAGAVLDLLFSAFPGSAKELPKDKGLFLGPRPGIFMNVESSKLQELLSRIEGAFVLTHDDELSRLQRSLGDYALILGIRESKGLEFKDVILVDFFKGLSAEHQKPWRNLLQGRNEADLKPGFPEIESHLKLLYTAITRCSGRLFIAETSSSIAGQAFARWATTRRMNNRESGQERDPPLAEKQEVQDVEKMVRTPDEWRSNAVDFCMAAESVHALEESKRWLDKAIYCFGQVNDTELARKARTHRASVVFRQELEERLVEGTTADLDITKIELEAAEILERLLAERLCLEARKVLDLLLPLLSDYSSEILQQKLLPSLPAADDDE